MTIVLDDDVLAVVASLCDPQTLATLCLTAYRVKRLSLPSLYGHVCIRTFSQAASFMRTVAQGPPSLAKLVMSYEEAHSVYMPHLVTPDFAAAASKALYRMSTSLCVLRLAHSISSLSEHSDSLRSAFKQMRGLRTLELYDVPADFAPAPPNTSLDIIQLLGPDGRPNSSSKPASLAVKRLIYQSCEHLRILRLTTCSVTDVVAASKGVVWSSVHTLAMDEAYIPDTLPEVFPNVHTLELWGSSWREKQIPLLGWRHLTQVTCIAGAVAGPGRRPSSSTATVYETARGVATLEISPARSDPLVIPQVVSACQSVFREKLETIRIGYATWDPKALSDFMSNACRGVATLQLELRLREARNAYLLLGLKHCIALQTLHLVFREQEAMAEFENRFLQKMYEDPEDPPKIPARTAFGTAFARMHSPPLAPNSSGQRGTIPRPELLRRITLELRTEGRTEDEDVVFLRNWEFGDRRSWELEAS
ncbi:hypothetical protein AURDEDRAFT_186476 [Auricularia subglabra TFB-10046 SS5]|nr:hypothetical protein AURDEDRAFT_186476 [Auricularia subglabra TFB-10046 SS5]